MTLARNITERDWIGVRQAIARIGSLEFGPDSTPEFSSVKLTGLSASQFVFTDASKVLTSVAVPLTVNYGGTGLTTITDHGLLLGSGTDAITPLGVATNGQIPIGSTGADPILSTITGTANQIISTPGAGTITLSTPQDIHTGASPTFAGLTLTGFTGVLWANTGVVAGDALLNYLGNPDADKTWNCGHKSLSFNFVAPSNQPTYDGAFEIQVSGAFTGDLFHVHQHTGNPETADLCHFEAEDADVTILRLQHDTPGATCLAVGASGSEVASILDDGTATLEDLTINTPSNIYALSHDSFADFDANEHFLQTAITNVSTALSTGLLKVTTGTGALSIITDNSANWDTAYGWGDHSIQGYLTSPVAIANGGSGQTTQQAAIDALTAVSSATDEYVLTKDTGTGNAVWKEAAGGGANHNILDGSVHPDSVAQAVTRGSIIYGNSTPKWDELVVGGANTFLGSDGTDLSYRTAAQAMASLSGAAGADFSMNTHKITSVTDPASAQDAATKNYVDVGKTNQCLMRLGTTMTSVTSGSWQVVTVDTDDFDPDNVSDTANNRIVPNQAGYYLIIGVISWVSTYVEANKVHVVGLWKNGTSRFGVSNAHTSLAGNAIYTSVTAIGYFNGSTDYMDLRFVAPSTATRSDILGSATENYTWMSISRLA